MIIKIDLISDKVLIFKVRFCHVIAAYSTKVMRLEKHIEGSRDFT